MKSCLSWLAYLTCLVTSSQKQLHLSGGNGPLSVDNSKITFTALTRNIPGINCSQSQLLCHWYIFLTCLCLFTLSPSLCFKSLPEDMCIEFREGGEERERKRENSDRLPSVHTTRGDRGSNLTLRCIGWCSNQLSHLAKALFLLLCLYFPLFLSVFLIKNNYF